MIGKVRILIQTTTPYCLLPNCNRVKDIIALCHFLTLLYAFDFPPPNRINYKAVVTKFKVELIPPMF